MSTTAALLDAGVDAVCFERSGVVMGERSAGSSRIFRLAHTDPDLVLLAAQARAGFARWAERAGRPMVDRCGCVVSGGDAADRAAAMKTAGAAFELVEPGSDRLRLPATVTAGPVLVDPEGGVVDVDAVRALLVARAGHAVVPKAVDAVEPAGAGAVVRTRRRTRNFDAVVLAAGSGTSALAAQVDIATPSALVHHFRVTFPFDEGAARHQSWIDGPADGLHTYQHRSGPGRWSLGGTVDPELVAWEVGRDAAVAASREVLLAYARERLTVEPRIVDGLDRNACADAGDGITFLRSGPVLAVHGENLMKFGPVLGRAWPPRRWTARRRRCRSSRSTDPTPGLPMRRTRIAPVGDGRRETGDREQRGRTSTRTRADGPSCACTGCRGRRRRPCSITRTWCGWPRKTRRRGSVAVVGGPLGVGGHGAVPQGGVSGAG